MAPALLELAVNVLLPTDVVPIFNAPLLVIETAFAPELLRSTAPVNALPVFDNVMACAPAVKDAIPAPVACVIVPDCVIFPAALELIVNVPEPTDVAPIFRAALFVSDTLFAPELFNDNAPVKLFNNVK